VFQRISLQPLTRSKISDHLLHVQGGAMTTCLPACLLLLQLLNFYHPQVLMGCCLAWLKVSSF